MTAVKLYTIFLNFTIKWGYIIIPIWCSLLPRQYINRHWSNHFQVYPVFTVQTHIFMIVLIKTIKMEGLVNWLETYWCQKLDTWHTMSMLVFWDSILRTLCRYHLQSWRLRQYVTPKCGVFPQVHVMLNAEHQHWHFHCENLKFHMVY